jgi:AAA domain
MSNNGSVESNFDPNHIARVYGIDELRRMNDRDDNLLRFPRAARPPLIPSEWANRSDLMEPDLLLGHWLSTTNRNMLTADTGLGKSNLLIALGMRASLGKGFLHWAGRRPCRVLYVDGEMSRLLLRDRLLAEVERIGEWPETFFALSMEDIDDRKPLNTPEGTAWLADFIKKLGGIDLAILDSIMCLTIGDMKDPEAWQKTLPLALALTKAKIGQVWVHHTGKNAGDSYGDKSREWQMDNYIHLDAVERREADIAFKLKFRKNRARTPTIRGDFEETEIALINDRWESNRAKATPGKITPRNQKALDALVNVVAAGAVNTIRGRRAVHTDAWAAECNARGLIDMTAKAHSARTLMASFRRELVSADRIACEGDWQWTL